MRDANHYFGIVIAIAKYRRMKMTVLARRAGVPYRTLQNYIYKVSSPGLKEFLQLCAAINVKPELVFGRFADVDDLGKLLREIDNARIMEALFSGSGALGLVKA